MTELNIVRHSGVSYIDSREVADAIGKRHDHLLRDITGYLKILDKVGAPKIGDTSFFVKSAYVDVWNREKPCYLLSKMGCELVAHKLTGEKGVLFTAAYIKRFNEMETAEREAEIKSYTRPRLGEFNYAVRNVLNGMSYCHAESKCVMNFLHRVYEPLGIEVTLADDTYGYLSATEIAEILGIISNTGRPHAHAVSAVISKLNDWARHSIAIPYGLIGVTLRYDFSIAEKVVDWFTENGFPDEVPHRGFTYHIYYKNWSDEDKEPIKFTR